MLLTLLVKFCALLAQLIAAIPPVNSNTSNAVAVALGVTAFIFGLMEGGLTLWRA